LWSYCHPGSLFNASTVALLERLWPWQTSHLEQSCICCRTVSACWGMQMVPVYALWHAMFNALSFSCMVMGAMAKVDMLILQQTFSSHWLLPWHSGRWKQQSLTISS